MHDYLLLMHDDATQSDNTADAWGVYLAKLRATGLFDGGSSIGDGVCMNKAGSAANVSSHLVGFLRIRAHDLDHARELVLGNPVFEAGGTVEIRDLPKDP